MKTATRDQNRTLAQTLAVQSQIHLPGTVGRLLKQIRDIEQIAPIFVEAGLIRSVESPKPLNLRVAGISTRATVARAMGGYLYASAAVRVDIAIENNAVSTVGLDSVCEIDDIDFENQSKRLQLIEVGQAYEMAEAAVRSGNAYDLILMDCPLVLNRSMVPLREDAGYAGHRAAYSNAIEAISKFWESHHSILYPWDPNGIAVVGVAAERYGAIVHVAQQDLRTIEGRRHVLGSESIDAERLRELIGSEGAIASIGESRFIHGILNAHTRTAAFRMNAQTPEMEPRDIVDLGVIGLHFKAAHNTNPILLQLIGDEPYWTKQKLDLIVGQVTAISVIGGSRAIPFPIQLAAKEQSALDGFIEYYRRSVFEEVKRKEVEDLWLSDLGEIIGKEI